MNTNTLDSYVDKKPDDLIVSNLHWKFAIRSVLRGENLLIRGDSGCGKTLMAYKVAEAFPDRQFFYINMGSTQDPRSSLIGNTHFTKEKGTFIVQSYFVNAIQTPNAIILLDELSRVHPEGSNILMTVLDKLQRYLRIDESSDTPTVKVAEGVTFLATANVGNEYTGTRTLDWALLNRFTVLMMDELTIDKEEAYLRMKFPTVDPKTIECIAAVADETRKNIRSENPSLDSSLSTRMTVALASLCADGFTFLEAAELCIYPFQSDAGGGDSPRTTIKQIIQNFIGGNAPATLFPSGFTLPEGMSLAEYIVTLNNNINFPFSGK